jgi:hypothetical protein
MAIYDQKCKLSKRTNRQISLALSKLTLGDPLFLMGTNVCAAEYCHLSLNPTGCPLCTQGVYLKYIYIFQDLLDSFVDDKDPCPAFAVLVDHDIKAVVLAIRGTVSISDAFVDADCLAKQWSCKVNYSITEQTRHGRADIF